MSFEASVGTAYLFLQVEWPVALAVVVILGGFVGITWAAMMRRRS